MREIFKRYIAMDTLGFPHASTVTIANVTDRVRALEDFDRRPDQLPNIEKVLVDGGYTGEPFALLIVRISAEECGKAVSVGSTPASSLLI